MEGLSWTRTRARRCAVGFVIGVLVSLLAVLPLIQTRARTAEAQEPVSGALGTACAAIGGPASCVAVGTVALAIYCQQTGNCTAENLLDAVDAFADWIENPSFPWGSFDSQHAAHPTYIELTQTQLDAWWAALGELVTTGGFTLEELSGESAYVRDLNAESVTLSTVGGTVTVPTVGGGWELQQIVIEVWLYDDNGYSRALWSGTCDGVPWADSSAVGTAHSGWQLYTEAFFETGTTIEAYCTQGDAVVFSLRFPVTGTTVEDVALKSAYAASLGFDFDEIEGSGDLDIVQVLPAAAFGVTFETTAAGVYNVPNDADDIPAWGGVGLIPGVGGEDVPLEAGSTPGTGEGEDSEAWWEGLVGGLRGAINTGNNILQNIYSTVTGIATSVTGIATAIADLPLTIANLFDPSVAWADFAGTQLPGVVDDFAAVAPGCYLADVGTPTLFGGGGAGGIAVTVGLPGNTIDVTVPVSDEVADVAYPLSQIAIGIIFFLWLVQKVRNPLAESGAD